MGIPWPDAVIEAVIEDETTVLMGLDFGNTLLTPASISASPKSTPP